MEHENENIDDFEQSEKPSKSSVKRDMLALQALGKALCELPYEKVKRGPVSERLLEAITQYQACKSFGAKKRLLQLIGKIMRSEEHEDIYAWVNGESVEQKMQVLHMHAAEQWRDRLIEEPNLLANFIEKYPDAVRANLNTMIRQASVERAANKAPRNYRQLYKTIYAILEANEAQ
jgi:ribosome-associated protein